ncbi:MAG TPA: hypothetical protein VIQ30_00845 [Pseudonocardia sp.]
MADGPRRLRTQAERDADGATWRQPSDADSGPAEVFWILAEPVYAPFDDLTRAHLNVALTAHRDAIVAELATALEGVHVGNLNDPVYGIYRCGKQDGYREAAGTVRHHYDEETP